MVSVAASCRHRASKLLPSVSSLDSSISAATPTASAALADLLHPGDGGGEEAQLLGLSPPLPTISLSPAPPVALVRFIRAHLNPPFTPSDLLRVLRGRLRHHPSLAPYDFHVFLWAARLDPSTFRHDHATYDWMVRTLSITGRLDALRFLLRRVLAHPCPCSDDSVFACPALEPTFRFAIDAFSRAGRLQDAFEAFQDVRRALDGRPSTALYNALIGGFARHRQHGRVVELYQQMVKEDRVRADVFTFNILISSCYRASEFDSALEWFREMRRNGCQPNVVTFNTLIRGFFQRKKFKEGISVAREMLDMRCVFSVATCEILMNGLCDEGKASQATDLLKELLMRGAVPDGYDCYGLVLALCAQGKTERGLEVVNSLWEKNKFPNEVVCSALIEELKNSGKINEASELMEKMVQKGMFPDSITCNGLFEVLCAAGRTADANRLRLQASRNGFKADEMTFGILLGGFSREGRTREGEGVLDEMLDVGFIPNIATYNRLIQRLHNAHRESYLRPNRNEQIPLVL